MSLLQLQYKCRRRRPGDTLQSQGLLDLINRSNAIGTVIVWNSGVLLAGVVAEQQHLLAVKGVFGPGDV